MRILVLGLTAGVVLMPMLAFAQDSTPSAQPVSTTSTTAATPSPDQIVCHYYYTHGMLVQRPDCHSLAYWEWRRHRLQEDIREAQIRALGENN
jgi:hypothetical protein